MILPPQSEGSARREFVGTLKSLYSEAVVPAGKVVNRSSYSVWITADNSKHCLRAGESSDAVGVGDADGLLLDGRTVLFDSVRSNLGGGRSHSHGALKVCDMGTLTVTDAPTNDPLLIARISTGGFICRPGDPAGYKSPEWCQENSGWDITTAPVGRQC